MNFLILTTFYAYSQFDNLNYQTLLNDPIHFNKIKNIYDVYDLTQNITYLDCSRTSHAYIYHRKCKFIGEIKMNQIFDEPEYVLGLVLNYFNCMLVNKSLIHTYNNKNCYNLINDKLTIIKNKKLIQHGYDIYMQTNILTEGENNSYYINSKKELLDENYNPNDPIHHILKTYTHHLNDENNRIISYLLYQHRISYLINLPSNNKYSDDIDWYLYNNLNIQEYNSVLKEVYIMHEYFWLFIVGIIYLLFPICVCTHYIENTCWC